MEIFNVDDSKFIPNYFNEVVLQKCNFGRIVDKIINSHHKLKNPDSFEYLNTDKIYKIIKHKYSKKQLIDMRYKYNEFPEVLGAIGILAGWSENKEIITIKKSLNYKKLISHTIISSYSLDWLKDFKTADVFKVPFKQFFLIDPMYVDNNDNTRYECGLLFGFEHSDDKDNNQNYNLVILDVQRSEFDSEYHQNTLVIPLIKENMYDNVMIALTSISMLVKSKNNNNTAKEIIKRTERCIDFALKLLSYVIKNNIANRNISSDNKNEPSNHTKDEIEPWDVTSRKGEPIGPKETSKTTTIDDEEYEFVIDPKTYRDYSETHQPPRPHMRRGHAHNYWCGSGENKHLEERWLKPIEVNHVDRIGPDQMPVVFHDTTDK